MDTNILKDNNISFKDIEQLIYTRACEAAREATKDILKVLDQAFASARDKSSLRDKGYRTTSIKTVYGEVEYSRHVYQSRNEEGKNICIYLLDQELGMDTIGMISTNLAEKIVDAAIDMPFRKAAELVSQTTGQQISHSGVWNVVQAVGEKLENDEDRLVQEFQKNQIQGTKETPILFEEMDGIWLKQQKSGGHKAPGMEVKIGTMYEGWKDQPGSRSTLVGKKVLAGIESGETFRERWEAKIQSIYEPEKIGLRILNGDGGNWIQDEYDIHAVKQMDRFHVIKMIRQKTSHDEFCREMLGYLRKNQIDDLLDTSQIYYDTICTAEGDTPEEQQAKELLRYLKANQDQLSNYKARGLEIPAAPKGILYKNMGVQENQNCTVIALRMKGKRKRWANKSANHMIRLLCSKENKELFDAIERYTDGLVWTEPIKDKLKKPLSASKVANVDGKGNNRYVDILNTHLPVLDSANYRTVQVFKNLIY